MFGGLLSALGALLYHPGCISVCINLYSILIQNVRGIILKKRVAALDG
jgi:hypothetical protein